MVRFTFFVSQSILVSSVRIKEKKKEISIGLYQLKNKWFNYMLLKIKLRWPKLSHTKRMTRKDLYRGIQINEVPWIITSNFEKKNESDVKWWLPNPRLTCNCAKVIMLLIVPFFIMFLCIRWRIFVRLVWHIRMFFVTTHYCLKQAI